MSTPPSNSPVPDPPDFASQTPLTEQWPAGQEFVRVFAHHYHATEFNPGSGTPSVRGRFHFFAAAPGRAVPILYGAAHPFAALAETVFHDVPIRTPARVVFESRLAPLSIVTLTPLRDLRLVQLHGFGLRRLSIRAANLTDTEAAEYPRTIAWARALHAALRDSDGLVWMCRQFNSAPALMLFGDRVLSTDLSVAVPPLPLLTGRGRDLVDRAANAAGIAVVR